MDVLNIKTFNVEWTVEFVRSSNESYYNSIQTHLQVNFGKNDNDDWQTDQQTD